MRFLLFVLMIPLYTDTLLMADLLSNETMKVQERLRKNPNVFDRTDQFCTAKMPHDACVITMSHFSGVM